MKTTSLQGPWIILRARLTGPKVSRTRSPNLLHLTLAAAFSEATRLAAVDPGATFSIFECIGQVIDDTPPVASEPEPEKVLAIEPEKPKGKRVRSVKTV